MLKIIKSAPNVTDLFVSLNVWSADNVSGLCRGLPLMDPTRFVLYDSQYRGILNKNSQLLLDTVSQCIKQWKNLNVFESPYSNMSNYMPLSIASALSNAPNLKILVIPTLMFISGPSERLQLVAKSMSLQSIQFKRTTGRKFSPGFYAGCHITHPSLPGLFKIPDDDPTIFPPNPTDPKPSSIQFSTTSVTENIWKRILYFAMALDVENKKARLGIVLVSKMFAKLALPYLFETFVFRTSYAFESFAVRSGANSSIGPQVRTIYLAINTKRNIELRPILSRTKLVNIIGLTDFNITPKAFSDLGKLAGPTLVRLEGVEVAKASKVEKPSLFSLFPHVRSLSAAFKPPFDATPASIPSGALASLEELTLSSFDDSLMTVLSHMDLLALRHATFPNQYAGVDSFLAKHGGKLLTLTVSVQCTPRTKLFDICPSIVDLTVNCGKDVPRSHNFTSASNHMALETITFKTDRRQRGVDRKWATLFQGLSVRTFPALRQISVPCIRWPTTEHDISKSLWVKWAEGLLDSNVKLVDGKGVGWRRRLKK
ncbi:hypothetical protein DFH09DRAFT_540087 [Mycena vulgaris]|nr:hypothetical protein DFH09DRAFT_540087 [Mycena vulgaris]